jgi:hypothetical protein
MVENLNYDAGIGSWYMMILNQMQKFMVGYTIGKSPLMHARIAGIYQARKNGKNIAKSVRCHRD